MKIILVFFLVIYHAALFYSLSNQPVLLRDSEEYIHSAISFETNGNFYAGPQTEEKDYRLYTKRTPLYPLVLYTFRALNLHWNYIYILQVFLGLFNIYLAFLLLKPLIKKTFIPYMFLAILILFTPSQFIYSQFIMADLWLQTFIMICVLTFALFMKTRNSIWLIGLVIFLTLAALAKPVFLFASFAVAIMCLYFFLFQKKQRAWAVIAVLPFLSWFALSSQNEKLTNVFHYSSIGNINLLHYNTQLYLNKAIGKAETEKLLEPLMIVPRTKVEFKENYDKVNSICKGALLSRFAGYLIYHCKGMVYFFLDPGRFDLYNFFRIEEGNSKGFLHKGADANRLRTMYNNHPNIAIGLGLIFLVKIIKTIGFIGFVWIQRKNPIVLAGATIVFYMAFLTGPLGASRFALPVELIIMCFASVFYGSLYLKHFQNLKLRKNKSLPTS